MPIEVKLSLTIDEATYVKRLVEADIKQQEANLKLLHITQSEADVSRILLGLAGRLVQKF